MIDLLNKIEGWVQNGPMGNDKQYVPLIMGGISLIGSYMAAQHASNQYQPLDLNEFSNAEGTGYLDNARALGQEFGVRGDEIWGKAQDLYNPRSEYNQTNRNYFKDDAADNMAMILRNQNRNFSSVGGGINASQVIAQNQNLNRQADTTLADNWRNYVGQQQNTANSLYGMASGMYNTELQSEQSYGSTMANAYIQKISGENQHNANVWGGFSQGLAGYGQSMGNLNWYYAGGWDGIV